MAGVMDVGKTAGLGFNNVGESSNITVGGMNNAIAGVNGGVGDDATKNLEGAVKTHLIAGDMSEASLKSLAAIDYVGEVKGLSHPMQANGAPIQAFGKELLTSASMGMVQQK